VHFKSSVSTAQVFAIAGPAMLANLTTPLIGIVSTTAIGRLGDAALLGGVAMASVIFDCMFWLFGFLRMSTLAFTAQSLGAGEMGELRSLLARGLVVAAAFGAGLILLQLPLASVVLEAMGGSTRVTEAARTYFAILTMVLVLGLDAGIAGAAIAAVVAEATGLLLGILVARHLLRRRLAVPRALLFDRARLMRMFSVNRDIMIRTAALITAFLFFTAQGARSGDVTLASNSVLNNFLLISAFFLDGLANAAQQLCGQAFGARDRHAFSAAARLVVAWGFAFAIAVAAAFAAFGAHFIDIMTAAEEVRRMAREYLIFVIVSPLLAVFAFAFDGIYIGATWARDMRNLMLLSLLIFLTAWLVLRSFGNAGLWGALLAHYAARGGLEAARYPSLLKQTFANELN